MIVTADYLGDVFVGMYVLVKDGSKSFLAQVASLESRSDLYDAESVLPDLVRLGLKLKLHGNEAEGRIIGELRILGVVENGRLLPSRTPPRPGSHVVLASDSIERILFGNLPETRSISLGYVEGYEGSVKAFLDLAAVTMHLAVLGTTGSGKSNTVGVLVEELGSKNAVEVFHGRKLKTVPIIILDANGDYLDYFYHPEEVSNFDSVLRIVFPTAYEEQGLIEPSERSWLIPLKIDLNALSHSDLADAIMAIYHGGLQESVLQTSQLSRALKEAEEQGLCSEEGAVDRNCLFGTSYGFTALLEILDRTRMHIATREAVKRALDRFRHVMVERYGIVPTSRRSATVGKQLIDSVTDPERPGLVIVDFSAEGAPGVELSVKQFVVYYLAKLLFDSFVDYRMRNYVRVAIFVLEEAQNYVPNTSVYPIGFSIARNILSTVATQGRKFGLSLCLVTQRPLYVDPVIMSMVNTFIIHRVPPSDVRFVETVTGGFPGYLSSRLTNMEKGEAIVVGQMNPAPHPLIVKVRKRRRHSLAM